jgi:transcriptional regulator GlxA family with amidase domain
MQPILRKTYSTMLCGVVLACAIALPSSADGGAEKRPEVRTVAILVFNGMDIQDFAGPADVFFYAGLAEGKAAFKQFAVAKSMEPITSQGFVKIVPNYTFADCPKPDILVIPGGGVNGVMRDEETIKWIKETGAASEQVLSVCTGALVLQAAGFLDGLKATTHWGSIDRLREQAPNTTVLENVRYVDNGQVVTSSGVSAGIDMSLHVVAKLLGFAAAEKTAVRMEYEWKPREEYPKQ